MLALHTVAFGGSIVGRVATADNEPLPGVNVSVESTVRGTVADSRGEFRIPDLPAGMYRLIFSLIGYQPVVRDAAVEGEKETALLVSMNEAPLQAEQIVVTASKREQSLQEVPVSISLLDATEIRQRNSLTLDEALRYVPGVNMTGQQINIRGSSGYSIGAGSRVLMLLDGIPFLTGDTGELIFEAIPSAQVDRIEVVKGASSALYGSNALGGVINVITKPIASAPEAFVRAYGGIYSEPPYGQWKWSDKNRYVNGQLVGISRRIDDFGFSLFFSRQLDDGYRQNDYRRRYNVFVKARQEFSASSSLTLNGGLLHQSNGQFVFWRNLDSALIPPKTNLTDNLISTRHYLSALYSDVLSDRLLLTSKAMWTHNLWSFQQFPTDERTESLNDGIRAELSARLIAGDQHTITAGIDGNIDFIGGAMFSNRTIGGLAIYGQDEVDITEDVTLTLGARYDFQSAGLVEKSFELNPKAGVAFAIAEGTTVRASFGRGFRVPSVAEAFIAAGGGLVRGVPNTNLKPERSLSFELGVSHMLGNAGSFDVAAFRSDYDNLIEPALVLGAQNLEVQWRNVTEARVQGVETAITFAHFDGEFTWNVGYTYVYPEDLTAKDLLKYRPRHLLLANARVQLGWFSFGSDFRFASRVDRIDEILVNTGTIHDGDARSDILVADFRTSADVSLFGAQLTTTLNIKNALQRNYVELIGNLMPPRMFLLSIEARM